MSIAVMTLTVFVALFIYATVCAIYIIWLTRGRNTKLTWHSVQRRFYRYWWPRQLTIDRPEVPEFVPIYRWLFWAFSGKIPTPARRRRTRTDRLWSDGSYSSTMWRSESYKATASYGNVPRNKLNDAQFTPGSVDAAHPFFTEADAFWQAGDAMLKQGRRTLDAGADLPEGNHLVDRNGNVIHLSVKRGPK